MIRTLAERLAIAFLPMAVSGCVAAALPIVASGSVAHKMLRSRHSSASFKQPAANASALPIADPTASASAAPVLPRPQDTRQMQAGVLYAGTLPTPSDAAPSTATLHQRTRPPVAEAKAGEMWAWADVIPFVANRMLATPEHSALLERGSSLAEPRWAGCGDRPRAILADLGTAAVQSSNGTWRIGSNALQWLEAMQTLDLRVIFTSQEPESSTGAVEAAFEKAGLGKLVPNGGFRFASSAASMPEARATAAASHCVLAVVGRTPADFPNAALPNATPPLSAKVWGAGWFRVADAQ